MRFHGGSVLLLVLGLLAAGRLCAVDVSTKDDLALDIADTGRVTGLRLGDASVPFVGQGGFSLAEYLPMRNPANLAPNPGFEEGTTSWRLSGDCRLDTAIFHSGTTSLRLSSPAPTATTNTEIVIPVKPNTRYRVGLWMRRDNVGVAGAYSSERNDQNQFTGLKTQIVAPMSDIERTWFPLTWDIVTTDRTTRLSLRADIFRATGAIWVDDFVIHEIPPVPYRPVAGTIEPAEGGIAFRGALPDAGLSLDATMRSTGEYLRVDGVVSDTTGTDRAVGVKFALPANLRGWRWYDDTEENREIGGDNLYRNTYSCQSGIGECSIYPWSAVSGPQGGLSLALPLSQGPRVFIIQHDQHAPELSVTFFVGLSRASGAHPSRAPFSFILYRHDAAWGMRAALDRYYRFFPESFIKRPDCEAYLNYVNWERFDPATHQLVCGTKSVPDASDFGEGYRFLFHIHGCYYPSKTMLTTDPALPSDAQVLAFIGTLRSLVDDSPESRMPASELLKRMGKDAWWLPTTELLKKIVYGDAGQICYTQLYKPDAAPTGQPPRYNWGLEFRLCEDPDLFPTVRDVSRAALEDYARAPGRRPWEAMVDADSIEGYNANSNALDYQREHFRTTLVPLTFGKENCRVALSNGIWDFLHKAWWPLTNEYQVVSYGNSNGYEQVFTAPYVDLPMVEYDWDRAHPGRFERYLRAINHTKPWRFWRVTGPTGEDMFDEGNPASVRRAFRRGLAYAIFPTIFELSNTDRGLEPYRAEFRQYVPAIEEISAEGWEPIPYARATGDVVVERYGAYADGELHLTLRNYADRPVTTTVQLDRAGLGIPAAARLVAIDILPGTPRCVAVPDTGLTVSINADDAYAVWIGTPEQAARHGFHLARATLLKLERLFATEMDERSRAAWQQALQIAEDGAGSQGDRLLTDAERLQQQLGELQQGFATQSPVDLAKLIMRARAEVSLAPVVLLGLNQTVARVITRTPVTLRLWNTGTGTLTGLQATVLSPWSEMSRQSQVTPARSSLPAGDGMPITVDLAIPDTLPRALMPYEVVITGKVKAIPFTVAIPIDMTTNP